MNKKIYDYKLHDILCIMMTTDYTNYLQKQIQYLETNPLSIQTTEITFIYVSNK